MFWVATFQKCFVARRSNLSITSFCTLPLVSLVLVLEKKQTQNLKWKTNLMQDFLQIHDWFVSTDHPPDGAKPPRGQLTFFFYCFSKVKYNMVFHILGEWVLNSQSLLGRTIRLPSYYLCFRSFKWALWGSGIWKNLSNSEPRGYQLLRVPAWSFTSPP